MRLSGSLPLIALTVGLFASAAFAQAPPPRALTADNIARVLDPRMAMWIDKHHGPGAVVAVVNRDGLVFAKGYGLADREAGTPFSAETTLVRPGSISKLFTAIAVMQLVDAGKLDLDRDVNAYIDFAIPTPAGGVPVTLRRLLTHRAGFEEHIKGVFGHDRESAPLGQWLKRGLPPRLFPNGDVESYSNYGFALAGYIVARVSAEPFEDYVEHYILEPLGMRHSTFRQPVPDELRHLVARGYGAGNRPLSFFEGIIAPAGGLSASATDMARFMRALLNGGALEGGRILPQARLAEMMAPQTATSAGYLGLAFFGTKIRDHDAIGHDGETLAFFSNLAIFPAHGIGVFAARDGIGEIRSARDLADIPDPAALIAADFIPRVPERTAVPVDLRVAGIYYSSRRAASTFVRLNDLLTQFVVRVDAGGNAKVVPSLWPFGAGAPLRRLGADLYLGPSNQHLAFIDGGTQPSFAQPALRLHRVPGWLDARWIAPAVAISALVMVLTAFCWPIAALYRRVRGRRWSDAKPERRRHLVLRLLALVDGVVIVALLALLVMRFVDLSVFGDALDPLLLALYAFAWLGVAGALPALAVAAHFWRKRIGSRWSRVHHILIATSSVMLAWFFLTFRIAGTTLNY